MTEAPAPDPPARTPPRTSYSEDAAGLTLTQQEPVSPLATTTLDERKPSETLATLVDEAFIDDLAAAVSQLVGEARPGQRPTLLEEMGVTALDGAYATVAANLLRDPRYGAERPGERDGYASRVQADFFADALSVTRAFARGQEAALGIPVPADEFADGPLAIFEAADRTPIIQIDVERSFLEERRADERRRVCAFISDLAQVADVRLVGSRLTHREFAEHHHADLPGSVREQCNPGRAAGGGVEEVVEEAMGALNPDGSAVWILRKLAGEATETLTYDELAAEFPHTRATLRGHISTLSDLGLVEAAGPDANRVLELTQEGSAVTERYAAEYGRQAELFDCVGAGANPRSDSRVQPPRSGGGDGGAATAAGTAPPEESPDDQPDNRVAYPAGVGYMAGWREAALAGAAPDGGIAVVDAYQEEKANRLEPEWGYNAASRTLYVAAEWDNPLAYTVRIARALASPRTFDRVLTDDVLDEIVGESGGETPGAMASRPLLRDGTCIGYLPDRVQTGAEFREELQGGLERLLDLTRELGSYRREWGLVGDRQERNDLRRETLRLAHGLAGVIAHLLALADVDLVREVRFPGRVSKRHSEDYADIATNLRHMAVVQSRLGYYAAYRQLFEDDEDKRGSALEPEVDAAEPFGELIGSFVVTGHGAEVLIPHLESALERLEPHEEAPDFALPVEIREGFDRDQAALTTRRMCERKRLKMTQEAVTALHGLCGSVYGVARALRALGREDHRHIRLDEVAYGLARLESGCEGGHDLLPEATPTERGIIAALLTADRHYSQAELAESANCSQQSVKNNIDRLLAMDLVRESEQGYRLSLPVRGIDEVGDRPVPWYVAPDRERDDCLDSSLSGVTWEVAEPLDPDGVVDFEAGIGAAWFGERPPPVVVAEEWRWFDRWLSVLRALTESGEPETTEVLVGDAPAQQALGHAERVDT